MRWGLKPVDEKKADIQQAIDNGANSASTIAVAIGTTRNSVIGFMHRQEIPFPGKTKAWRPKRERPPQKLPWIGGIRAARKAKLEQATEPPTVVEPEPEPVPVPAMEMEQQTMPGITGKPFIYLGRDECHWPLFDELNSTPSQSPFCGAPALRPHGYCADHLKQGTRP